MGIVQAVTTKQPPTEPPQQGGGGGTGGEGMVPFCFRGLLFFNFLLHPSPSSPPPGRLGWPGSW